MPGGPQRNAPQRQALPHLAVVVTGLEALVLRTDVSKTCTHVVRGAGQHDDAQHRGQHRLALTPPGSTPLTAIPSGLRTGQRLRPTAQPPQQPQHSQGQRHAQQRTARLGQRHRPQTGHEAHAAQHPPPDLRSAQHQLQRKQRQHRGKIPVLQRAAAHHAGPQMSVRPRDAQLEVLPAGQPQCPHGPQRSGRQQPAMHGRPPGRQIGQQHPQTQRADQHLVPVTPAQPAHLDLHGKQRRIAHQR